MSSFSSKQILILALIASSISGIFSASISDQRYSNCSFQPEIPIENVTFAATKDDTAGAKSYSFIEVKHNDKISYLPLKLEKVEQIGHLGENQNATLRLVMDCATIDLDMTIAIRGEEYNGTTIQSRVTFEGEQKVIDKSFLSFKKYIYRGFAGYSTSWNNLDFESRGSNYTIMFRRIGFIMESKNVTYNYDQKIRNELGYQANWF